MLNRFPRIWHRYFSHGTLKVAVVGQSAFRVNLRDAVFSGGETIEGNVGRMQATVECKGERRVMVAKDFGSDPCDADYSVSWCCIGRARKESLARFMTTCPADWCDFHQDPFMIRAFPA